MNANGSRFCRTLTAVCGFGLFLSCIFWHSSRFRIHQWHIWEYEQDETNPDNWYFGLRIAPTLRLNDGWVYAGMDEEGVLGWAFHEWFRVPIALFVVMSGTLMIVSVRRGWPQRPGGICQQCGYNLFGNVSGICPECGKAIVPAADSGD